MNTKPDLAAVAGGVCGGGGWGQLWAGGGQQGGGVIAQRGLQRHTQPPTRPYTCLHTPTGGDQGCKRTLAMFEVV